MRFYFFTVCMMLTVILISTTTDAATYSPELLNQVKALRAVKECPLTITGIDKISGLEAKKHMENGSALFLDNRTKAQFEKETIKGAEWFFSEALLNNPEYANRLDRNKTYILFCSGDKCWRSSATALMLKSLGFNKLYWYREGLPNWKSLGLPLQNSKPL